MATILEQTYWACSDLINLGARLPAAEGLPTAEVLERRIASLFDQLATRARQVQIPEADVTDIRYALAAFIDEQLMRTEWPGRQQWLSRPLQFIYFQENTAGEGFFQRLADLQAAPHRAHVLQIYYFCLVLGFRGKFAVQGAQEVEALIEQARSALQRQLEPSEPLSPNGTPRHAVRREATLGIPWVALTIGVVITGVVVYLVLVAIIGFSASSAIEEIQSHNQTAQVSARGRSV